MLPMFLSADVSSMDTAIAALESGITDIATGMGSMVGKATPIALGIVGTVMVIVFGVKFFRKITGKAG